jgi:hypothetical protein
VDSNSCEVSSQVCTLVLPCTDDPFAAGSIECFQLSTPAKGHWIADAQGRNPDQFGDIDPFYSPIDTQNDCDGVTLFDSPTLLRNGPGPFSEGTVLPNPDETQQFMAKDYVVIDNKVVASVTWGLKEEPNKDEEYLVPSIVPGPPSVFEQQCFADLMIHYHLGDAFAVPSDTNPAIKCRSPYY